MPGKRCSVFSVRERALLLLLRAAGEAARMLCEICNKKEATVHFKQVFEGAVREVHVCEACAAEKGFDTHLPESLADFLFGVNKKEESAPESASKESSCAACGMTWGDFKKTSRLGCPNCYAAFATELEPMILGMQKGFSEHCGKRPASAAVNEEIEKLQKALKAAISAQNFEEAARIRDQIKIARSRTTKEPQPAGRSPVGG